MKKIPLIKSIYLLPATIIFFWHGENVFAGLTKNITINDNEMFFGLFVVVIIFMLCAAGIGLLWYLLLFPEKFTKLKENYQELIGSVILIATINCCLIYMIFFTKAWLGCLNGFPTFDTPIRSAFFALSCIGPLRIVSISFFNWSAKKFLFFLLLLSLVLLIEPIFWKFILKIP
jgi:hypothetical protein